MKLLKRRNYSLLGMLIIALAILSKTLVYTTTSLTSDSMSIEMDFDHEKDTPDTDFDFEFGDYFIHPILEMKFKPTALDEIAFVENSIIDIPFTIYSPPPDLDLFFS